MRRETEDKGRKKEKEFLTLYHTVLLNFCIANVSFFLSFNEALIRILNNTKIHPINMDARFKLGIIRSRKKN